MPGRPAELLAAKGHTCGLNAVSTSLPLPLFTTFAPMPAWPGMIDFSGLTPRLERNGRTVGATLNRRGRRAAAAAAAKLELQVRLELTVTGRRACH